MVRIVLGGLLWAYGCLAVALGACFAVFGNQAFGFGVAGEVDEAIAGHDFVKEVEVDGDGVGEGLIGAGGEHEVAAPLFLLAEPGKHILAVGQEGGVERHAGGDPVFEGGASAQQLEGGEEEQPGARQEAGQSFMKQIGFQQGAVEIDAQGGIASGEYGGGMGLESLCHIASLRS